MLNEHLSLFLCGILLHSSYW